MLVWHERASRTTTPYHHSFPFARNFLLRMYFRPPRCQCNLYFAFYKNIGQWCTFIEIHLNKTCSGDIG
jgi:hypothetical protein